MEHLLSLFPGALFFSPPTSAHVLNRLLPETSLVSLLIIAAKLFHDFPPLSTAYVISENEPAFLNLDWTAWSAAHALHDAAKTELLARPFKPGQEMDMREEDVTGMTAEQMDAYMDWYARTWLDERPKPLTSTKATRVPNDILDLFPVGRHPAHGEPKDLQQQRIHGTEAEDRLKSMDEERLKSVQQTLQIRGIVSEGNAADWEQQGKGRKVPRVGDHYRVYKSIGDLEGIAKELYERAASFAGMDVEMLLGAVRYWERKLKILRDNRKRKGKEREEASGGERAEDEDKQMMDAD